MNIKLVLKITGKTMLVEALLMVLPIIIGLYYGEGDLWHFIVPIGILCVLGLPLSFLRLKENNLYAKEGFITVSLCWIVLSLIGAMPFCLSGQIPNYVDALFETVSGFTTTGASVLKDVDILSKSCMFWRIFTHFLGGMGVLVFVLAILPETDSGIMHLYRAESPGPSASKIVGKLKQTARILYGIYVLLTVIETVLLLISGIGFYDSLLTALSTAGTGGFAIHNGSIAYYNSPYIEIVVAIFMFLFGINFNIYYLILTGNFLKAIKSEEFITYIAMVLLSTVAIAINLLSLSISVADSFRYSFFQVASISSTTGFGTATFENWPAFSKSILLFLTVIGASGGSTGGGIKVSRFAILLKSCFGDIKKTVNPRAVVSVKYEGKPLTSDVIHGVRTYFGLWITIVIVCTIALSLDFNDLWTNFSATLACIGNIGPGLTSFIGSNGDYMFYSAFSKILLSFVMLIGRLEILPMLILFSLKTWRK